MEIARMPPPIANQNRICGVKGSQKYGIILLTNRVDFYPLYQLCQEEFIIFSVIFSFIFQWYGYL